MARKVEAIRPTWISNGAAHTAVDKPESEPELALAINATALGNMARAAERAGTGCCTNPRISFSTVNRIEVICRLMRRIGAASMPHETPGRAAGKNFALIMPRLMKEKFEVPVVTDQIGRKNWATGIAHAIWGLGGESAPGEIFFWTDVGVVAC